MTVGPIPAMKPNTKVDSNPPIPTPIPEKWNHNIIGTDGF